ncbi:hypothetical protein ACEPAH_7754 [Sanghuangporus vaninii]
MRGRLFKINQDYAHEAYHSSCSALTDEILLKVRSVKLLLWQFDKGAASFGKYNRAQEAQDETRLRDARKEIGSLERQFQEEHQARLHIFYEDVKVKSERQEKMLQFLASSRDIFNNGTLEDKKAVEKMWDNGHRHATIMWSLYEHMETRVEQYQEKIEESLRKYKRINQSVSNQHGAYSERDILEIVSLAWTLDHITTRAQKLFSERNVLSNLVRAQTAKECIDGLMKEMEALHKEVKRQEQKRMKENLDRLRKDKRKETHVKYEVRVKVDKVSFSSDVYVRDGQPPMFCAAKINESEPPRGAGGPEPMNWTPPVLEALLETTDDPLVIVLKELRVSSSLHGTFSEMNISIKLPQKTGSVFSTSSIHNGSIGGTGSHSLKITSTKVKSANCVAYLCKEPSKKHWINSGR